MRSTQNLICICKSTLTKPKKFLKPREYTATQKTLFKPSNLVKF